MASGIDSLFGDLTDRYSEDVQNIQSYFIRTGEGYSCCSTGRSYRRIYFQAYFGRFPITYSGRSSDIKPIWLVDCKRLLGRIKKFDETQALIAQLVEEH